jgi:hypothetical protein
MLLASFGNLYTFTFLLKTGKIYFNLPFVWSRLENIGQRLKRIHQPGQLLTPHTTPEVGQPQPRVAPPNHNSTAPEAIY